MSRPRRARAPRASASKPKVSAPLRRAIKAVTQSEQETKYVGQTLVPNTLIPAFATTPNNLLRMLPGIVQGAGEANRIGDRVEPVRATTRWTVHFQNGVSNNFEDLEYNLLVLRVKGARTALQVAAVPSRTLLKDGLGGNVDPNGYTQPQFIEEVNHYPVNTDQYTVLKHFKHRFAKGSYDVTGVPGAAATSQIANGDPCVTFSYTWKPPPLVYNDATDIMPTNHYPVYIHWVSVKDAGIYSGNLFYGCRTDMFFKDG